MQIKTATCSYQGGRDYNEDTVRCAESGGVCAVIVADGLGGHGGGQIASALAAETVINMFTQTPSLDAENIRTLFDRANAEVISVQTAAQKMKSTGAALFAIGGAVTWAHVGDTRLYYFKNGRLTTRTIDHSVSQAAVFSGEITDEQIRHHPDRNKVLRAFGANDNFKPDIAPIMELDDSFHVFLLCTDGFWEYVFELEMELDLAKCAEPQEWLDAMRQRLARRVPRDNDNYSAAAVFIRKDGEI